jgi:hypothetical protein
MVCIQYITFGFSPQVFPDMSLCIQKSLQVLLVTLSSWYFHVGPLSEVFDLTGQLDSFIEEGRLLESPNVCVPSERSYYRLNMVERQICHIAPLLNYA